MTPSPLALTTAEMQMVKESRYCVRRIPLRRPVEVPDWAEYVELLGGTPVGVFHRAISEVSISIPPAIPPGLYWVQEEWAVGFDQYSIFYRADGHRYLPWQPAPTLRREHSRCLVEAGETTREEREHVIGKACECGGGTTKEKTFILALTPLTIVTLGLQETQDYLKELSE